MKTFLAVLGFLFAITTSASVGMFYFPVKIAREARQCGKKKFHCEFTISADQESTTGICSCVN